MTKLQRLIRLTAVLLPLLWWSSESVLAQERPLWGPTVTLKSGAYVQTGIGILPADAQDLIKVRPGVIVSLNLLAENSFCRILKLSNGRFIIYEVVVKPLDEGHRFEVTLRPADLSQREWQVKGLDPARVDANFLQSYSAPLTVNDGDIVALDVLVNPRTGAKLIDYFRVTSVAPKLGLNADSLSATPREFAVEDVDFTVLNYEIRRNGESIFKSTAGISGRFVWIDIPQVGRFLFSLTPRPESEGFQPAAFVDGKEIVFNHGRDRYELISDRSILPAAGVFRLWVRYDPDFSLPRLPDSKEGFRIGALEYLPSLP